MMQTPLVSVGIPTYNRPEGLRHTLECMINQTYPNLEIIVSNNASPDPEVEAVAQEFIKSDPRVRYYRQPENKGSMFNFSFVFNQAQGDYFMWAADDDRWAVNYIERIMQAFAEAPANVIAICSEAQYTINNIPQPFSPEGAAFYSPFNGNLFELVKHILKYNYGNLFYAVYKRDSLYWQGQPIVDLAFYQNEIAFFCLTATRGIWQVIPETLFFKETNAGTYQQARWEIQGGALPSISFKQYIRGMGYSTFYHL